MNFYCCVHSQEAIDTRKKYAQENGLEVDMEIPWQYICGTNARNKFTDPVINAHDYNEFSKYNKHLRNYTSLLYILNKMPPQKFFFTQCTLLMKNNQNNHFDDDITTLIQVSPYDSNGEYKFWIGNIIKTIVRIYGESEVRNFFKDNFYGFDIFGKENKQLRLWMCCINGENPYVREMLNEAIIPFCNTKYINMFYGDLIPIILHHVYKIKYSEKIKIQETLNSVYIQRKNNDKLSSIMHYDGT